MICLSFSRSDQAPVSFPRFFRSYKLDDGSPSGHVFHEPHVQPIPPHTRSPPTTPLMPCMLATAEDLRSLCLPSAASAHRFAGTIYEMVRNSSHTQRALELRRPRPMRPCHLTLPSRRSSGTPLNGHPQATGECAGGEDRAVLRGTSGQ